MTRRQRDDPCATSKKERIDRDQQCGAGLLREIYESRLDVAIAIAGVKDFDRNPEGWNTRMHFLDNGVGHRSVATDERDETVCLRRQLTQQSEQLRRELHVEGFDSCGVACWPIEAGDETQCDRVGAGSEDDRNA